MASCSRHGDVRTTMNSHVELQSGAPVGGRMHARGDSGRASRRVNWWQSHQLLVARASPAKCICGSRERLRVAAELHWERERKRRAWGGVAAHRDGDGQVDEAGGGSPVPDSTGAGAGSRVRVLGARESKKEGSIGARVRGAEVRVVEAGSCRRRRRAAWQRRVRCRPPLSQLVASTGMVVLLIYPLFSRLVARAATKGVDPWRLEDPTAPAVLIQRPGSQSVDLGSKPMEAFLGFF
jgi:hypothetical protein